MRVRLGERSKYGCACESLVPPRSSLEALGPSISGSCDTISSQTQLIDDLLT